MQALRMIALTEGGGAGRRERAGALRDGHDLRARQGPREATGCMCRN